MKNRVIFCLFLLSFNLSAQPGQNTTNLAMFSYKPLTGTSNEWMTIRNNDTTYSIKVRSFDGVPYKGQVYLDMTQQPISEIHYWDSIHIAYTTQNLMQGEKMSLLMDVLTLDTLISFRTKEAINMYIINPLNGDTILAHNFLEPVTDTIKKLNLSKWTQADKDEYRRITGKDITENVIEKRPGLSSLTYTLPPGIYFAYFVNTNNKLRWAQKIVKQ